LNTPLFENLKGYSVKNENSLMMYSPTVKPKCIQTPDILFDIFLVKGVGHYS